MPVLAIVLLIVTLIHARSSGINSYVTPLSVINDLPSNSVSMAYEDSDGYIWLGTQDGLCRYDGYRLKTWRSHRGNPGLLTDNDISAIAEDRGKNILIGTRHGLNVLNAARTAVWHPSHPDLRDYEIRDIVPHKDNSVWIGTYRRLVRASERLDSVWNYESSLPTTSVNTVYRDHDGNIWVSLWQKGIYRYNPGTDRFEKGPAIGRDDNPMRMLQVGDSYLIGTWGNGLWRLSGRAVGGYAAAPVHIVGTDDNLDIIFGLASDRHGNVWLISHSGVYSGRLQGDTLYLDDISKLSEPMNNMFNRIMCDKDGNIWITASSEAAYIISQKDAVISRVSIPAFSKGKKKIKPSIRALYHYAGRLWFNQPRIGLVIYDIDGGKVLPVQGMISVADPESLTEVYVITEFADEPGRIYVGPEHYPMIYIFDRRDGIHIAEQIMLNPDGFDGGSPRHIVKDKRGNLWIATDKHVLLRGADGRIVNAIDGLRDVQSMLPDENGNVWIASPSKGIFKLNVSANTGNAGIRATPVAGTSQYSIVDMAMDRNHNTIWAIGKLGHVIGLDRRTGRKVEIDEMPDFRNSEYLQDIVVDKNNNKWLSSGKYIFRFSPDFKNCVQYSVRDAHGGDPRLNKGAVYYDGDTNTIYYGCYGGYLNVSAETVATDAGSQFPPRITDVKLSGQSLIGDPDNATDFNGKTIYIPADAKDIQFEFSTLQYANPDKIRYSYRLKGVDKDWVSVDGGSPIGFYNNIPSGDYVLEVRATDDNGQWGAPARYRIRKEAAWYETWWAYAAYFLIFCLTIAGIYIYVRRRNLERNAVRAAQLEKKNAEELAEIKLKYFANISHDFLTPITIISCLVDDVETVYGKIGPHLDKIRFNLAKVKALIQQILDYRKIETGNMRLSVTENELCDFVDQICRNHFQPLMDKKHINFSYEHDCEPIIGYFDVDKVEKILFNIISNAYKYTPEGGSIDVKVNNETVGGREMAVIKVADTGVGISKKDLDKIFTRFYTIDREERVESNGIGLSLVKDLVELHHGSISVESAPGKGSVFTLRIPVSRECYANEEIADLDMVDSQLCASLPKDLDTLEATDEPVNRDITLLLVEDNEELLLVMSKIFARTYHVLVARNGREARAMVEKNDVDIIVSDVMMPEMDGLEFCHLLKSDIRTSHIPIILLTAKSRPEDRVECYRAGADGYISKPFELPVLVARIDNFITNKQSRQEKFKDTSEVDSSSLELSSLDKEFLDKVIALVNEHIDDEAFDIDSLAREVCMSRSSMYRKVKAITGMSPVELVRNIKLKRSYELLREGRMSVSQVAYAAGFSNPKYFSTCFKEQFGISPRDVAGRQK